MVGGSAVVEAVLVSVLLGVVDTGGVCALLSVGGVIAGRAGNGVLVEGESFVASLFVVAGIVFASAGVKEGIKLGVFSVTCGMDGAWGIIVGAATGKGNGKDSEGVLGGGVSVFTAEAEDVGSTTVESGGAEGKSTAGTVEFVFSTVTGTAWPVVLMFE